MKIHPVTQLIILIINAMNSGCSKNYFHEYLLSKNHYHYPILIYYRHKKTQHLTGFLLHTI